jgi:tRNA threonylcarbamoyladenosine biosynthesis protein TsaB
MTHDALILSYDTATSNCSIALTKGGFDECQVIASLSLHSGITHSRRLLGSIDWLLRESSLTLEDVSAIAVGLGPGSFTGLRIGMATAKGLCQASDKPLIGISSLDAIAASVSSDKLICALLDARKKEVYGCFYRCGGADIARPCSEAFVMEPNVLAQQILEPVILAGDGVDVYAAVWDEVLGNRCEKATNRQKFPAADIIGFLAAEKYHNNDFLSVDSAVPAYVRASDAELSLARPSRGFQLTAEAKNKSNND